MGKGDAKGPPKGGAKAKAGGGGGQKRSEADAAAADEDMHRMEMCVGWIYEFFSRHRLEEAQEGELPNETTR
jgi:hypothetical protein